MTSGADAAASTIAVRQHGLITNSQAHEIGLTSEAIRHRVSTERWKRLRDTVYSIAGAPATWEQAALAAVLAINDCLLSHNSALALWGFQPSTQGLEVLAPRNTLVRAPGVRPHRTLILHKDDYARVKQIPVTSVERTIVDCSGNLLPYALGKLVDEALRRDLLDLNELGRCVSRLAPAPGRKPSRVREVLSKRLAGFDPGESALEAKAIEVIAKRGLPLPVQQHQVGPYRIDLAYPEYKIAIEVDGWAFHQSRTSFELDRARDNDLTEAGWRVLRVTSDTLDQLADRLERLLQPALVTDRGL